MTSKGVCAFPLAPDSEGRPYGLELSRPAPKASIAQESETCLERTGPVIPACRASPPGRADIRRRSRTRSLQRTPPIWRCVTVLEADGSYVRRSIRLARIQLAIDHSMIQSPAARKPTPPLAPAGSVGGSPSSVAIAMRSARMVGPGTMPRSPATSRARRQPIGSSACRAVPAIQRHYRSPRVSVLSTNAPSTAARGRLGA
jgi:hypothetical protein